MTLQCWMHWFWITLCTVIAVLPPAAFGVPVPLAVGESSPDISSILHQIPSVHNNAVRNTKPLPPAADPHPVAEQIQLKNAVASQNNKSVAENRAPVLDQEESKRNKVPVKDDAGASAGVFPVPAIDDSGDSAGGVPLDLAAAAVGLKPPEKVPTRPPPVNKELELRYNAVIADSLSIKSTDAPNCSECTTAATASQQAAQIVEPAQNSTELDPLLTDESKTELSLEDIENITGFTNPSLLQEQSTEEILSWSSLSVQESREHPTGKMMSQASSSGVGQEGMDPVAIAGISLGVLAIATLASAASFVLYRTRYLNNPQTLSDKCSNPDSSGYIDDSTMRENSEEMYSLDNDSFLNSLEAMTIQNYWTDSVKHTKL